VHLLKNKLKGYFFHVDYLLQKSKDVIALIEQKMVGNSMSRLSTENVHICSFNEE
jgi:Uri superfamily endonuclease